MHSQTDTLHPNHNPARGRSIPRRVLSLFLAISLGIGLMLTLVGWLAPRARAASTFVVSRTDDPAPDGCAVGDCSLREAILAANANPGPDVVQLPPGTYVLSIAGNNEDAGMTGDLDVTDPLTITGAANASAIVDANGIDRALHIISATAVISGVSIVNGNAITPTYDGGGIYFDAPGQSLTLINTTVMSNTAIDDGGGLHVASINTAISILNTAFLSNTVLDDGAGINLGLNADNNLLDITNSTFIANDADDDGGGVRINGSDVALNITDSYFERNTAGFEGGALHTESSAYTITISGSAFLSNTAPTDDGGAINLEGRTVITITNSLFQGNVAGAPNSGLDDGGAINFDSSNQTAFIQNSAFIGNWSADDGGALSMENFTQTVTISNSLFLSNTAADVGGAIYNEDSPNVLNIMQSELSGNTARIGGAVGSMFTLTLIVEQSTIAANQAYTTGGGVALTQTVGQSAFLLQESQVYSNSTSGDGGGVFVRGILQVFTSTISGNTAGGTGGGIAMEGGFINFLVGSEVAGNQSGMDGGGIANGSLLLIFNSTVAENMAQGGGGGITNLGLLGVYNSTVSSNRADQNGGGILQSLPVPLALPSTLPPFVQQLPAPLQPQSLNALVPQGGGGSFTLQLINTTISGNQADADGNGTGDGGGLWLNVISPMTATNTIIAGNTAAFAPDCAGPPTSADSGGYNLVGNSDGCNWPVGVPGDQIGTAGTPINPALGPLQNNGGATRTHMPLPGSPAIDSGNDVVCASLFPTQDQRGVPRPVDGDGDGFAICDIGSVETTFIPGLSVAKTPGVQTIFVGDSADFTITITNTGNVSLTNFVISDTLAPDCETGLAVSTLGPNQSTSYTCSLSGVSSDFTNTITVTAEVPFTTFTAMASDSAVVQVKDRKVYLPIVINKP